MGVRIFDPKALKTEVVSFLKKKSKFGTYDGTPATYDYAYNCRAIHTGSGTILMYTRDFGMHDCGWWKNPDYARCFHLSLSFLDTICGFPKPKDHALTKEWLELFFGDNQRFIWAEPPYSSEGKRQDIWHYRVFCDPSWSPIIPRKEVYSKDFTPKGWKSFSELGYEKMEKVEG